VVFIWQVIGCHVAQSRLLPRGTQVLVYWFWLVNQNFVWSTGFEPVTSPFGNDLARSGQPMRHHVLINMQVGCIVFKLVYGNGSGRDRAGA
jgi:hypothetical protein